MPVGPPSIARPFPRGLQIQGEYWAGGARGELRVLRCEACQHLVHPPTVLCPWDHHPDLRWQTVSGRGRVESWTESRYSWASGVEAPYIVALVALEEDPTARILTNVVGASADHMEIGMPVEVTFERLTDDDGHEAYLPLFQPVAAS